MPTILLPDGERVFVPHKPCTESSGVCFSEGRCLSQCRARSKKDLERRVSDLERRLVELERIGPVEGRVRRHWFPTTKGADWMEAKHTPGPWVQGFGRATELPQEFLAVGLQGDPWMPIALLSPSETTTATDRANARLISEAPALLDVALMIDAYYSGSLDHQPPFVNAARDALRRIGAA